MNRRTFLKTSLGIVGLGVGSYWLNSSFPFLAPPQKTHSSSFYRNRDYQKLNSYKQWLDEGHFDSQFQYVSNPTKYDFNQYVGNILHQPTHHFQSFFENDEFRCLVATPQEHEAMIEQALSKYLAQLFSKKKLSIVYASPSEILDFEQDPMDVARRRYSDRVVLHVRRSRPPHSEGHGGNAFLGSNYAEIYTHSTQGDPYPRDNLELSAVQETLHTFGIIHSPFGIMATHQSESLYFDDQTLEIGRLLSTATLQGNRIETNGGSNKEKEKKLTQESFNGFAVSQHPLVDIFSNEAAPKNDSDSPMAWLTKEYLDGSSLECYFSLNAHMPRISYIKKIG